MTASGSQLYNSALAELSDPAATDWSANTIKIALVTSTYTFAATHDFFNDLTNELSGTGYTAGGATLASKTEVASGATRTYDAADPVWSSLALAAGTPAGAVIYRDTGNTATSPLLAYIRLPGTAPDGTDYTVVLPSDGVIVIGANVTLQWVDLGPWVTEHGNSADADPNSVFSSITASGNNITIAIDNSASVDGASEGFVVALGDPALKVPGWSSSGATGLAVYITISANAPDSKAYWVGVGISGRVGVGYDGVAVGYRRSTTSNEANTVASTTNTVAGGATSTPFGVLLCSTDGDPVIGAVAAAGATGGAASSYATGNSGGISLAIYGGCESSTNDGPHSATVRIRVAAIPLIPA